MSYQEFQENWKTLSDLINQAPAIENEQLSNLSKQYIEQNILILNDVFATSIDNLKQLQFAKSMNDIVCIQAQFTHEISRKFALSTQRFLNTSLTHISDYNEWLKAHCDLATD